MSPVRIDWSSVHDNSSSIDAVVSFAGGMSLRESEGMVWDPDVKVIFRELRKLPVKVARNRAKAWCNREFFYF